MNSAGDGRTLVVMLGASTYSRSDLTNECFARSHADLRSALVDVLQFRPGANLLDYFDNPDLATWAAIQDDLGPRLDLMKPTRVVVTYIGHGHRPEGMNELHLGLLGSDEKFTAGTVVTAQMLGGFFNERARGVPHFYLVDACYGGSLVAQLQHQQSWNAGGTVVLAAAAESSEALVPPNALHSAFAGPLIDALRNGLEVAGDHTVTGLCEKITRDSRAVFGASAPSPVVRQVPLPAGIDHPVPDLLHAPIFPNASAVLTPSVLGSTWELQPDAKTLLAAIDLIARTDRSESVANATQGRQIIPAATSIGAEQAVENSFNLKRAAAEVASAELLFADVTDFEPSVMFLLGIRAAVRRGVTICSTQASERERMLRAQPFHLRDVPLATHGSRVTRDTATGLARRATSGLDEMRILRHGYQDLPAFDAIRSTHGPGEAHLQRPWYEFVLVLCPFGEAYSDESWPALRENIDVVIKAQVELQRLPPSDLTIARTIDLDSPRIVSHALFEALRRTQLCVFDLTHWRPGVLFELGVRLAVNRQMPVCVIDAEQTVALRELTDGANGQADWNRRWEHVGLPAATALRIRSQALRLLDLLEPVEYSALSDDWRPRLQDRVAAVADPFYRVTDTPSTAPLVDDEFIHLIWRNARGRWDEDASIDGLLSSPVLMDSGRDEDAGYRYLVYPHTAPIWDEVRATTLERQLMVWMYLGARARWGQLDGSLVAQRVRLEKALRSCVGLNRAGWVADASATLLPPQQEREETTDDAETAGDVLDLARVRRARAKVLQRDGRFVDAYLLLASTATDVESMLAQVRAGGADVTQQPPTAREREAAKCLTQLWGEAGGNARRAGRLERSVEYYTKGSSVEQDERFDLVDSYNLTNRLVVALMLDGDCYDKLADELASAAETLRVQVSGRRQNEWWAWADAAILFVLAGQRERARLAKREYLARGDRTSFDTTRSVVTTLAEQLRVSARSIARELTKFDQELAAAGAVTPGDS